MTTDELLNILPSAIGNNPMKDEEGNVVAYLLDKPEDSYNICNYLTMAKTGWLLMGGKASLFV